VLKLGFRSLVSLSSGSAGTQPSCFISRRHAANKMMPLTPLYPPLFFFYYVTQGGFGQSYQMWLSRVSRDGTLSTHTLAFISYDALEDYEDVSAIEAGERFAHP
jgi:hypothetical protein